MKAFVFSPSNSLFAKLDVQGPDQVAGAFQEFLAANPTVPINSYVEMKGRKWVLSETAPFQLHEVHNQTSTSSLSTVGAWMLLAGTVGILLLPIYVHSHAAAEATAFKSSSTFVPFESPVVIIDLGEGFRDADRYKAISGSEVVKGPYFFLSSDGSVVKVNEGKVTFTSKGYLEDFTRMPAMLLTCAILVAVTGLILLIIGKSKVQPRL